MKNPRLRWGVLGVSKFAMNKCIPGIQGSALCEVTAIASRDLAKAREAAAKLGIATAYGSYEELLADPNIDIIYNPLPNHLHVPWSIAAARAGKHVLCEKPLALSLADLRALIAARDAAGVIIGEAFMVRTHPQWLRTREIAASGRIGELRAATGFFSYTNVDPLNIRNRADIGGGALWDIGCYPVTTSRLVFGAEPTRVAATIERDPAFGTDRLSSFLLEFPQGHAAFTCSTQLVPYQRMQFLGTKGRIDVEIPFNAPPDRPARIFIDDGGELFGSGITSESFATGDQYTWQADAFARAVLGEGPVPVPLEDSLKQLAVLSAIFTAAESGRWERVSSSHV
ncbi:MAG: Gfo/Idh/MocA family oxidoreductase [Bryobacteraceae bacterium]|nr:Gfo/Idh/MocA family oxidoreductase [Bryobacteraceae bacterium]